MIDSNSKVTLHFALKFEEGDIIDSTFENEAATFVMGDGSLLAGFEKKLIGMATGEKQTFTVLPEEGFGQPNPNNVQQFARSDFAEDLELAEGLVVSFADASQSELPGVVKAFDDQSVTVDFNHPLAGRKILFDVEILNVETA